MNYLQQFIWIIFMVSFGYTFETFAPIQAFSIRLDRQAILKANISGIFKIYHKMETSWERISKGKAIGSITQINTVSDPEISFYFKYELNSEQQRLVINIFVDPVQTLSENFLIVLDFMVAQFPSTYSISILNMTSFQEHIMIQSDRNNQLVPLLNGFNNLSLSGNITHGYNFPGEMYTVHYMSSLGVNEEMGWQNKKDNLLFTTIVMPNDQLILKFRLSRQRFVTALPKDYKYFYGIKGIATNQFAGTFQQSLGSIKFQVLKNPQNKTYGLAFLPYATENLNFKDFRLKTYTSNMVYYVIFGIAGSLFLIIGAIYLCYNISFQYDDEQSARLNRRSNNYSLQNLHSEQSDRSNRSKKRYLKKKFFFKKKKHSVLTQTSENRGPGNNLDDTKISTVPQVDQKYEDSLRGTPKIEITSNVDNINNEFQIEPKSENQKQ